MPFRKSARITVTNESDKRCDAFYYYLDWQKYKSLPKDTAYFHAMYRQEYPCVMGRNYLIADLVGRGHYVGTVQSVQNMSSGWYGEGDDFFFIDGEAEPSLRGTGTEDYFCDGWGFRQHDGPFYGVPLWEGYAAGNRGSVYRFHIPDPVPFKKSLRVEIEHKGSQEFPDARRQRLHRARRPDVLGRLLVSDRAAQALAGAAAGTGAAGRADACHCSSPGRQCPRPSTPSTLSRCRTCLAWRKKASNCSSLPQDDKGWVELTFNLDKDINAHLGGQADPRS